MIQDLLARLTDLVDAVVRSAPTPISNLDRSLGAATAAHFAARRALAVAIAEEEREAKRRAASSDKLADLEQRAVAALRAGREDIATGAAEMIAALETEVEASGQASVRFAAEVALARREVDAQRRRLAELDRGRRLAKVGVALNAASPRASQGHDVFTEAEAALCRIEADNHDARAIRDELATPTERLIEQMSDLGFGAPVRVRPADVLSRLRAMAAEPASLITSIPQR